MDTTAGAAADRGRAAASTTMRAATCRRYGPVADVTVEVVDRPEPAADQLLVRVEAASVNPVEWHLATGTPYFLRLQGGLRRPKDHRLGLDVAGEVVAVGADVEGFAVGDAVFGAGSGSLAEFTLCKPDRLAHRPGSLTAEEAAVLPVAGLTALQGLRDKGAVEAGQRVLVNGAAGGVGTCTVQVAVAMGAEVTAVCSAGKAEMVASLGAERVIDYEREDFLDDLGRYDVLFDNVMNRPIGGCLATLVPGGRYVMVGGRKDRRWFGPVPRVLAAIIRSRFSSRSASLFIAQETAEDLAELAALADAGKLRPVIGHRHSLDEVAEALEVIGGGHATGKVVVVP